MEAMDVIILAAVCGVGGSAGVGVGGGDGRHGWDVIVIFVVWVAGARTRR